MALLRPSRQACAEATHGCPKWHLDLLTDADGKAATVAGPDAARGMAERALVRYDPS